MEAELPIGMLWKTETPLAFDDLLRLIKQPCYVPTLTQTAYARVYLGNESELSQRESDVREGAIYCPERPALFVLNSPMLATFDKAIQATNAHREHIEYFLDRTLVRHLYTKAYHVDLYEHPFKREVLLFPQEENFAIDRLKLRQLIPADLRKKYTNGRLTGETIEECIEACKPFVTFEAMEQMDEPTLFALGLFKEMAIPYALFIDKDMYVKRVRQKEVESKQNAFARQLRFDSVPNSSCIVGESNYLDGKEIRRFLVPC